MIYWYTNAFVGIISYTLLLSKQVRVSARTLAGYGVPSREALLRTRIAPPSAPPQPAHMVSATPNSITVGWVPPKYENGERLARARVDGVNGDKAVRLDADATARSKHGTGYG